MLERDDAMCWGPATEDILLSTDNQELSKERQDGRVEEHSSPLLIETPKSELTAEQLSTKKTPLEPNKKDTLHHVWIWELDCEEGWAPKNWCFWTVVLEKTLESPLDCKEIQPVHSKGNQSWVFIGRTDAKAETPILWRSNQSILKEISPGYSLKDWC